MASTASCGRKCHSSAMRFMELSVLNLPTFSFVGCSREKGKPPRLFSIPFCCAMHSFTHFYHDKQVSNSATVSHRRLAPSPCASRLPFFFNFSPAWEYHFWGEATRLARAQKINTPVRGTRQYLIVGAHRYSYLIYWCISVKIPPLLKHHTQPAYTPYKKTQFMVWPFITPLPYACPV